MPFLSIRSTGGTDALRTRVLLASAIIGPTIAAGVSQAGQMVADALAAAAPRGQEGGDSLPLGGDTSGPLSLSFESQVTAAAADYASVQVVCSQPTKLRFVVEGRGPVSPVTKRALMWRALDHPVMSAKATEPNDFVTPAVALGETAGLALLEAAVATELGGQLG